MKRKRMLALGIFLILAIGGATAWLVSSRDLSSLEAVVFAFWEDSIRQAQQARVRLLCESNHQKLLRAGREILSAIPPEAYADPALAPGEVRGFNLVQIPPNVSRPEAIRNLRARGTMLTSYGYLLVEMHGGMDHFGLYIYPENFKPPDPDFKYGDRQLIPGLWYYDHGYLNNPSYDQRIDALIETHKAEAWDTSDRPTR